MRDRNKRRKSIKRNVQTVPAAVPVVGPTLREFWEQLKRAKERGAPMPGCPAAPTPGAAAAPGYPAMSAPDCPAAPSSLYRASSSDYRPLSSGYRVSSGRSSGSSGGSCGLGYGLGLIVPDAKSQKRVMDIMRELCEKDAKRAKRK